jgi:hypothetical protein
LSVGLIEAFNDGRGLALDAMQFAGALTFSGLQRLQGAAFGLQNTRVVGKAEFCRQVSFGQRARCVIYERVHRHAWCGRRQRRLGQPQVSDRVQPTHPLRRKVTQRAHRLDQTWRRRRCGCAWMCALSCSRNFGHASGNRGGHGFGHGHGRTPRGASDFDPGQQHHHQGGDQPSQKKLGMCGDPCARKVDVVHLNTPPSLSPNVTETKDSV